MASKDSKADIPLRLAKLSQQIDGKAESDPILSRDGLLDSLLAVYGECERTIERQHNAPTHIRNFVQKVKGTINKVQSLRVNPDDFVTVKLIGQGNFGQVKVVKEKTTGEVYALKVIRKKDVLSHQDVIGTDDSSSHTAAYFEEERDIMSKGNNAWLTQLHYAFQDKSYLYLAMDFHPGGDLAILLNRHEALSEDMARFYIAEMTLAIHAVHTLGYIHRDIKPDNFLIDRIGHLKLTDFGSAAKMDRHGKVSGKMPVGTPDYIAPELLTSMTSSSDNPYNRLVDWWSLGIITYEMIRGVLPFSDENNSVVSTYSNIMKFKEKLAFTGVTSVSVVGKEFITGLLTDCRYRMGFDQITAHQFFDDMDLQRIRNSTPPCIPKVSGAEDTSNFDDIEARPHSPRDEIDQPELKDVPFIGFTCYRNFALRKAQSAVSTAGSTLTDRLLPPLVGDHDGSYKLELQQYERKQTALRKELEKMHSTVKQKDSYIDKLEREKETQDREMAYLYAANSDLVEQNEKLARNLVSTRDVYERVLGETEDFMQVYNSRAKDQTDYEVTVSQELDNLKSELERMDRLVVEKEAELVAISRKVDRLEGERNVLKEQIEGERQRADKACQQLSSYHKADRHGTLVVKCEIETQHVQSEERVSELQQQLDKVMAGNRASKELMEEMKEDKLRLEQELDAVKSIASRRHADRNAEMKRHTISDTERMKLSRLEVRNAELGSEINEKGQQSLRLANKISELTDQVEDAHRQFQAEKRARVDVEKSLRDRIEELERRLSRASADADRLRSESYSVSDSEPENKRITTEQEQTIAILKANVEKLENLVCGMRDGFDEKEQRRDQRGRQETRRWAEIVGELKQENMYLERKVEHLNTQLQAKADYEDSHKDRLKQAREDLREVKAKTEGDLADLNKKLLDAEVRMSDAKSEAVSTAQSERILRRRFESVQKQLKESENLQEQRVQDVQTEKQTLCDQIEILKEETKIIDELETELTRVAEKCASLEAENKSLRDQTRRAVEAKTQSNMQMDQLESRARAADRKADTVNEELRKLKLVCNEMELNAQDLESLVEEYERRQAVDASDRKEMEATVTLLQNKTERLEASLHAERNQRQAIDDRNERHKQSLQNQVVAHRGKEENLQKELDQQRAHLERLRKQAREQESEVDRLDKERRSIKVRLSQTEDEIRKLKEETSTWKTQVANLKATNCKLNTELEMVMDNLDEISAMKNSVENSMDNLVLTKEHEQYRSEQTLSQQSKLIDFLQQKYEAPIKRKKRHQPELHSASKLFSYKKKDSQRDEFSHALESERTRTRRLQDEVQGLKTELYQTKVSSIKGRDLSSFEQQTPAKSTTRSEPDGYSAPRTNNTSPVPAKAAKPPSGSRQTMKHNIPHRLSVGLNTRATKCAVCQNSVMFGKQAARCQECRVVTHEKCKSDLAATCGLPTQFMQLYSQSMTTQSLNSAGGVMEADLRLVELGGWMKVKGLQDTSAWTKRFVLLENEALSFYASDDTDAQPLDHLELCPISSSASVRLISDVNPVELLSSTSPGDMPYIIKLEALSRRGSRVVYLLTANFAEKEKWDSTIEAIVRRGCMSEADRETKLLGNRLLQLAGDSRVDVNCTTLVGENDVLLLGAEEGLLACQLSYTSEPLIKVEGIGSVYQMSSLTLPDQLVMITGRQRWLSVTSYSALKGKLLSKQNTISGTVTVTADNVGDLCHCSMFTCCENGGRCTIVAATPTSISVINYSNSQRLFKVVQEVDISEPCSCISYTPGTVLFGTDTIYKLNVNNGCIRPFLRSGVKPDTGYNSPPIDILCVTDSNSSSQEFLCCFSDIGVFVDGAGNKTRQEDIQWSGLPLSFVYRTPYLYIIYYKAMQVIGPLEHTSFSWKSLQTFLNIQSPRYLGPAYTDGAVYVASLQAECTDIVVFKGNMETPYYEGSESSSDAVSVTESETASESDYSAQEKRTHEFYQRNNKENHPKNQFPTMVQRYHAAAFRTGVMAKYPKPQQQQSDASISSSSSSMSSDSTPVKPRNPLNTDYYNHIYGSGKKTAQSQTPQHSNV